MEYEEWRPTRRHEARNDLGLIIALSHEFINRLSSATCHECKSGLRLINRVNRDLTTSCPWVLLYPAEMPTVLMVRCGCHALTQFRNSRYLP